MALSFSLCKVALSHILRAAEDVGHKGPGSESAGGAAVEKPLCGVVERKGGKWERKGPVPVLEHIGYIESGSSIIQRDGVVGADFAYLREDGLDGDLCP